MTLKILIFCSLFCFSILWGDEIASVSISSPPVQNGKKIENNHPPFVIMAPVTNKITYDINWSPYSGGECILFADRSLEKLETYLLSLSGISYQNNMYARFFRLVELISIWLPENYFAMVLQHEVFGHGYRVRDLLEKNLAQVIGYDFNVPPPYGPGGASTAYVISSRLTTSEECAIASAGVEATAILAQLTKLKWLESRRVNPRQALLYLFSEQDLTLYIDNLMDIEIQGDTSHDLSAYITMVNYTYPDTILTKQDLQNLSWINLADPFTFYAIFSWFYYLASGKESKVWMIGSTYLPNFRLGLTPFGPEIFFENYFALAHTPLYVYLKGGSHAHNQYFGVGFYAPKLWKVANWSFGLRADLWRQPKLLTQPGSTPYLEIDFFIPPSVDDPLYPSSERHAKKVGGALSVLSNYQINEVFGYDVELGYKSKGFLPGYSLFAFPTVRASLSLKF